MTLSAPSDATHVPGSEGERAVDVPTRRNYAKGRAKRDQIIQAAIGLFGEVGFHAASLRDISARAGISHPGLLHHFATKTELLAAVLEHRDAVDLADVEADIAQGRGWIEAVVRLMERNSRRRPVVELFASLSSEATSPDHPAHAFFVARYADTLKRIEGDFREWARDGRLRADVEPASAARAFVALMDGLQIQWLLSLDGPREERVNMERELRAYLALLAPTQADSTQDQVGHPEVPTER